MITKTLQRLLLFRIAIPAMEEMSILFVHLFVFCNYHKTNVVNINQKLTLEESSVFSSQNICFCGLSNTYVVPNILYECDVSNGVWTNGPKTNILTIFSSFPFVFRLKFNSSVFFFFFGATLVDSELYVCYIDIELVCSRFRNSITCRNSYVKEETNLPFYDNIRKIIRRCFER